MSIPLKHLRLKVHNIQKDRMQWGSTKHVPLCFFHKYNDNIN